MKDYSSHYLRYIVTFSKKSKKELNALLKEQRLNRGWGTAKSAYLRALKDQVISKN